MRIEFYVTHGIVFGFMTIAAANALYDTGGTSNSCPPRFYGDDCKNYCPYPFFGNQCKGKCECRPDMCHHHNGCPLLGTKCPLGFTGRYCNTPCEFPFYGDACQKICSCPKTKCNVSTGCIDKNNNVVNPDVKTVDFVRNTRNTGIIEAKINKNANMNEDIGFSMDPQSYFRTSINDDFVIDWTGKPLPKQHPPVNKNTFTQNIVISVGVVLIALVLLHVLLTINNCIKGKKRITFV